MLNKKDHLHTLERSRMNPKVYRCMHPECTYFQRAEFVVGKKAMCVCGRAFIIPRIMALKDKRKTLVCEFCTKSKKSKQLNATTEKIQDILAEILPIETPGGGELL